MLGGFMLPGRVYCQTWDTVTLFFFHRALSNLAHAARQIVH